MTSISFHGNSHGIQVGDNRGSITAGFHLHPERPVQVMETRKRKLGEDHPDTLSSMANLAFTWKSSGNDAEAVKLLRDCLVKQQQTLGQNHPDTLSTSEALLEWETEKLDING
ncbi:hypothetical protein N7448_003739 [Penicillium atrosanguineum]|nr:hypothetical protein N7448_003739 [Penicillium atrosanguineum]